MHALGVTTFVVLFTAYTVVELFDVANPANVPYNPLIVILLAWVVLVWLVDVIVVIVGVVAE